MSAVEERWDLVVVGLQDSSRERAKILADELSRLCGMPSNEVLLALMDGEVPVHAALRRPDAEREAMRLDGLGAAVDLRLSLTMSTGYPILKPDAKRQSGTAVGGFIDDSATPPRLADSGVRSMPLEPDGEGLRVELGSGLHRLPTEPDRPVVTRRRVADVPVPAPPAVPMAMAYPTPYAGPMVPYPMGYVGPMVPYPMPYPSPQMMPQPDPISLPYSHTPARSDVDEVGLDALSSELDRLVDGASAESLLGDVGGDDASLLVEAEEPGYRAPQRPAAGARELPFVGERRGDSGVRPVPRAPTPPEAPALPSRFAPASEGAGLELDFAAAGMRAPPPGRSLAAPGPVASAPPPGVAASPIQAERRPLLGPEPVSATMFALAIGLVMGSVVALILQRRTAEQDLDPLYDAWSQARLDASKVASGELRDPVAIEKDIEDGYRDARMWFFVTWLGVGVPVGLLLARLRR